MKAYMSDRYGVNRSGEIGFQNNAPYQSRAELADPLVDLLKHQASVEAGVAVQKENAKVQIENYKTDQKYSVIGWSTGIFGS